MEAEVVRRVVAGPAADFVDPNTGLALGGATEGDATSDGILIGFWVGGDEVEA